MATTFPFYWLWAVFKRSVILTLSVSVSINNQGQGSERLTPPDVYLPSLTPILTLSITINYLWVEDDQANHIHVY